MKLKQLLAEKKESINLGVELANGASMHLSDYLRLLESRIEELEARAQPSPAAASAEAVKDHDISDRG